MSDLLREVTELRAEVTELRTARPVEDAELEPEADSGTWERGFNSASLARDIDLAMSRLGKVECEIDLGEDDEPEDEPIDAEERKRLELEAFESHPELKELVEQFNAQAENSPSSETATVPDPESGEQRFDEKEMDDQVQSDTDPMSDDEIQALLAEAAATDPPTDVPEQSDDSAGESTAMSDDEIQALLAEEAATDPPTDVPEQSDDSAGESTAMSDDEVQALLAEAGSSEPVSAGSSDEDQPAVANAASDSEEQDTEAESSPPAEGSDDDSGAKEQPVELGFTAFQAGKEIEESEPEQKEEPVAEPPTVPKFPERQTPSMELDPSVIARVPAHLAVGALAVPMRIENGELVCRVAEPFDQEALDRIANALAMRVVPEPAPIDEVVNNLRLAYSVEAAKGARSAVLDAAPRKLHKKRSNKKRRKLSKPERRAA